MRVVISSELKGVELYGGEDPESVAYWCDKEVTIRRILKGDDFPIRIEEDHGAAFCMEEIEHVVSEEDDVDILESDVPFSELIGGIT